MNSRGFTVVELLASFSITMLIVVFLFQIVLDLKDIFVDDSLKTQINNRDALITTSLNNKLEKTDVTQVGCDDYSCNIVGKNTGENGLNIMVARDGVTIGNRTISVSNDSDTYIDMSSVKVMNYSSDDKVLNGRHNSFMKISYNVVNDKLKDPINFNYIYSYISNDIINDELYVSSGGSDESGDGSKENPFRTISKAYEVANFVATIYIMDDLSISGPIVFNDYKNIILTSADSDVHVISKSSAFSDYLFKFNYGNCTLKDIVLDGKNITDMSGGVLIEAGAKLTINDNATIKNFKVSNSDGHKNGGGIRLNDGDSENDAVLVMNGGTITGNTAPYAGGIHMGYYSRVIYNKGSISGNSANGYINSNFGVNNNSSLEDRVAGFVATDDVLTIRSQVNDNFVVDVNEGKSANGTNVQIYQSNGTSAQKWKVKPFKTDNDILYYSLESQVDGTQYLWIDGNKDVSGTNISTWISHGSAGGYFAFKKYSDGYYQIKNILGTCVDLYDAKASNGNNIWAYTCNDSNAQRWRFASS